MKKLIISFLTATFLIASPVAHADSYRGNGNGHGNYGHNFGHNIRPGQHYDRSHDYYRPLRPYAYKPYYYRPSQGVVIVNRPAYYDRTVYVERAPTVTYYDSGRTYYNDGPAYYVSDRYVVGSRMPSRGTWRSVPSWYAGRLPPVRHGERYVYADRDLLLVDATSRILSAFILASAID